MDAREEIIQIVSHKMDSGDRERIIGLRGDNVLMIWNWTNGEWSPFMSPKAGDERGFSVNLAALQGGAARFDQPKDRRPGTPRTGIMDMGGRR